VLFEDTNANSVFDEPPANVIVSQEQWPRDVFPDPAQGGGDGLTFANRGPGCAGNPAIRFRPNSIPANDACGLGNGSAFLTNTVGNTHTVIVNISGSVRIN
jgi:hypothetical protein